MVISACSNGHSAKPPSSNSASPSRATRPSPASASPTSATDAAVAAYRAYLDAARRAEASPPEDARTILAPYALGDYLDFMVGQVRAHHAAHLEASGKPVVHITNVQVATPAATIHDCQDASNVALIDQRTHRLVPRSRGTTNINLVARMKLGKDGRWRVLDLKRTRGACHP